jgi:hypothetical protein
MNPFTDFIRSVGQGFARLSHTGPIGPPVVYEDEDEIGYRMQRSKPKAPCFTGATRETKRALLAVMPESEWDRMRENALTGFREEGRFEYEEYTP